MSRDSHRCYAAKGLYHRLLRFFGYASIRLRTVRKEVSNRVHIFGPLYVYTREARYGDTLGGWRNPRLRESASLSENCDERKPD